MPGRDPSRLRARPVQSRSDATREAIVTAAEQLLGDVGYDAMTTNAVAERAGVNIATLYRYFSAKEAIVGVLVERVADTTERAALAAIDANAAAPLDRLIRAVLVALVATPAVPRLHRELFEHQQASRKQAVVDAVRSRAAARLLDVLRERRSELDPALDLDAFAFLLGPMVEGATNAIAFHLPEGPQRESALDLLMAVILRSLTVRPPADAIVPPRIVVSRETGEWMVDAVERPRAPTEAMLELDARVRSGRG